MTAPRHCSAGHRRLDRLLAPDGWRWRYTGSMHLRWSHPVHGAFSTPGDPVRGRGLDNVLAVVRRLTRKGGGDPPDKRNTPAR